VSVIGEYTKATFTLKADATLDGLAVVKFEGGRPEDFKAFAKVALADALSPDVEETSGRIEMDGDTITLEIYSKGEGEVSLIPFPMEATLSTTDWRTGDGLLILIEDPTSSAKASAGLDDFREVTLHVTHPSNDPLGTGLPEFVADFRAKICCTPQNIFDIFSPEVEEKLKVEVTVEMERKPYAHVALLINHGGLSADGKVSLELVGEDKNTFAVVKCDLRHCIPFENCLVKDETLFLASSLKYEGSRDLNPSLPSGAVNIDISDSAKASLNFRVDKMYVSEGFSVSPLWKLKVPEELKVRLLVEEDDKDI
jgi:hypothetical protein